MLNKNKHTIPPAPKKNKFKFIQNKYAILHFLHFTFYQDGNNNVLKQQKHISI